MANLFDLLTKKNNPEITPIQLSNDGSIDNAASLALKNQTTPLTLGERLTGRTMTQDTQTINPQTGATKLETFVNYRPGLLNDIAGGYKENRFTPASLNNFGQNTLADGRNKGFAYKLGEGFGSLARFGESPLGRSLLVGGAIGALGGSPAEALAFGTLTGATNQANRTRDNLYRNSLNQQGIDTSNIHGYLTDNMYKNATLANYRNKNIEMKNNIAQAKDNTSRAKMIGEWLKLGMIDPENANALIKAYGISDADFQASNDTRKSDAIIENIENPKPKHSIIEYKGIPAKKTVNVNNTYEHLGGTGSKYGPSPLKNNSFVTIKAPNGAIKKIPAGQVEAAIAAGGVRI